VKISGEAAGAAEVGTVEIGTAAGTARAEVSGPARAAFLLVLTHGSGGGVATKDVLAAAQAGRDLGAAVALVTQPFRVRGARAPGPARAQDAAWLEIVATLQAACPGVPLVQGGRSNGARVACRTARAAGARAVLALAFPVRPPGRPDKSRLDELRGAGCPVLAVSGDRDPFGQPAAADASRVVILPGEGHTLARRPAAVADAVRGWLSEVLGIRPAAV
jgi:predicted alpha/beta-hydrolase family hydrolase